MNIPNKVKIGAHEYEIVFRDDLDSDDFMGVCRPSKLKIFIDGKLPQSQQEETFIHEVLHAIFHLLGKKEETANEEEKQVQPLGHAIYQFLKENDLLK